MATRGDGDGPGRGDLNRVSADVSARLEARGIVLDGRESAEDIVEIANAVERFEGAVQSRGGDLMVDEGPRGQTSQPDDPHFALPLRRPHETVAAYIERLARATDDVRRHHPPRS
jgi:hypothetical protein